MGHVFNVPFQVALKKKHVENVLHVDPQPICQAYRFSSSTSRMIPVMSDATETNNRPTKTSGVALAALLSEFRRDIVSPFDNSVFGSQDYGTDRPIGCHIDELDISQELSGSICRLRTIDRELVSFCESIIAADRNLDQVRSAG